MMTTNTDLLASVRKRIDELTQSYTNSLIACRSPDHDRLAGKIEALTALRKDLAQISREFQAYDPDPEDAQVINPQAQRRVVRR